MRFDVSSDLAVLSDYVPRFIDLVGRERFFKRLDHLDVEQRSSPFRWKVVADYHWLEMAIGFQSDVLAKEGGLLPGLVDQLSLAALCFAATVVELHERLTDTGRRVLQGRLRDGLNQETGYAGLYLEVDLLRQLVLQGFDVQLPDMEGSARFDIEYSSSSFSAEIECKSISADAGRQIHRNDFYRFMEAISPALRAHQDLRRQEVLVVTLNDRLSPKVDKQAQLGYAVAHTLQQGAPTKTETSTFRLERLAYADCLADVPTHDRKSLYEACSQVFGPNTHIAGALTEDAGCLVVMRSARADDTSKPLLDAMRKAASQFSGTKPAFIAVQFQEIEPPDLMLPHLRRRAGILSYALFGQYRQTHVAATYFCGFGAVVVRDEALGTPGFSVPNPESKFTVSPAHAPPFLVHVSDAEYAAMIGAPLPAENISFTPFEADCEP